MNLWQSNLRALAVLAIIVDTSDVATTGIWGGSNQISKSRSL